MAGLLFTPFNCQCCHHPSSPLLPARASFTPRRMHMLPAVRFSGDPFRQKRTRGLTLVAGAGPSSSSYAFAFVFPLSLLAATIFASIRISDKLDRDFLEEITNSKLGYQSVLMAFHMQILREIFEATPRRPFV
ncbi:uncharacterized protein LOC116188309 isoform X2 [Punica granatum]|uniref:Uncharacterized protein LOC116188309 isoform X2 n=1 Tax=Punica granatum TaxID=22663 RepID=A0A6P8BTF4_PUNGR|nr:uncharacterized protein LOC116188309 isoform X2 [Punica granatum]